MPIQRPSLVNGEIYHVVTRGVEGRNIFLDINDYWRGIRGLYEFNDINPVHWEFRRKPYQCSDQYGVRPRTDGMVINDSKKDKPRKRLVDILAFCLMPNHTHLLLRQIRNKGISLFMQKLGTGYACYFNFRNERQGHLFQGRFKAVHVKTDDHLKIAFVYIHTNPAFLVDRGWKGQGIANPIKVIKEIESFKWSSYKDYLGVKNFPSITERSLLGAIMSSNEWRKYTNNWIYSKTIEDFQKMSLE